MGPMSAIGLISWLSTDLNVLIDVAMPHDGNLVKAEKNNLSKYLDLAHELTDMWDVDSTIIVPIVVSANGLIAKRVVEHLKRLLPLDGWIKGQIQKDRLRKIIKIFSMKQLKIILGVMSLSSCFIIMLTYYWNHSSPISKPNYRSLLTTTLGPIKNKGTPMEHVPLDEIYGDIHKKSNEKYFELEDNYQAQMVDTDGCKIPLAMINYDKSLRNNIGKLKVQNSGSCGKRAVFLKKSKNNEVHAFIRSKVMRKYLRRSATFHCCYRFIYRSNRPGFEDSKTQYTKCTKFENNSKILLEYDYINVKCYEYDRRNASHEVYDDVYGFTKKIEIPDAKAPNCKTKYSILMLGMDSMSLPRFVQTMPRTAHFFQDKFWLGFRGYHKIGDNTFPNLMATLTGKNLSVLSKLCSKGMDECSDDIIWNMLKNLGYVTAYGEDYLRLPDTFANYKGFRKAPTDHYMRPLFLKGEKEVNNYSLVCSGKTTSGQQLLDFALDFVNTYRDDLFFGIFWMNSFSHNVNSRPQDADKMFENFFNQLSDTRVQDNTFVIFFSDHGIRFGENRLKMESYYDERMPLLFISTPLTFKGRHPVEYKDLTINQFRLVTPYDLHSTIEHISRMSVCSKSYVSNVSEACPKCQSLFDLVSTNRTCQDVAIDDKWCSCHKLYPLDVQDTQGIRSIMFVIAYIKSLIKSMETRRCWSCLSLSLNKVIRIHFYYTEDKSKLYYVVAFAVTPGNVSYEAVVMKKQEQMELVGSVSVISPYRGLGKCTIRPKDRLFCVCQKNQNCT